MISTADLARPATSAPRPSHLQDVQTPALPTPSPFACLDDRYGVAAANGRWLVVYLIPGTTLLSAVIDAPTETAARREAERLNGGPCA